MRRSSTTTTAPWSSALGKLQREAENWAGLDPALDDVASRLDGLRGRGAGRGRHAPRPGPERWEADPARLDEVEERLQLLRRLEAKYGKTVDELIAYRDTLDAQESRACSSRKTTRPPCEAELHTAFAELQDAGHELSKAAAEGGEEAGRRGAEAPRRPGHGRRPPRRGAGTDRRSATTR